MPEELDERIDRFLQAEEEGLRPNFSNANLARDIFSRNDSEKGRGRLIPFCLQDWPHAWLSFSFRPSGAE